MARRQMIGMRAFYTLIAGQFISTIGSGMTRFGLGVWVFTETGDTTAYTTLLFFAVFSVGLGALFAGPLVDRWSRRRVMIISNTAASFSTLVITFLFFTDTLALWHLYLALFVNGVANAFILPSLESSVPLLVPKEKLTRAAGLSQLVQSLEIILSPALAGFVVSLFGLGVIFIVDFVTFGASIMALLLVAIPQPRKQSTERTMHGFWQDFAFGIRYIRQRPAFIYLLSLFSITMFLLPGVGYSLITPLVLSFANEESLGLIISGFGVGSLIGGILLATWGGFRRRMHGILASMTAAGLAAIVISLRESTFLIGLGFVVTGISFVFIIGLNRVIWQMKVPPHILGRIFSLQMALGVGGQSLGILLAGTLADNLFEPLLIGDGAFVSSVGALIGLGAGRGMALMFMIVGILELFIVLISFLNPSIRLLEDRLPDYKETEIEHFSVDAATQTQEV